MTLLRSCCFLSIKSGSKLSGYYTLVFYLMILTAGTFHIHSVYDDNVLLGFTVALIVLAALTVLTSILLIIGLHCDNSLLLVPWILITVSTTFMDIVITIYLLSGANFQDPFFICMVFVDFAICAANIYCLLCVLSQYQIYRRRPKESQDGDKLSCLERTKSVENEFECETQQLVVLKGPNDIQFADLQPEQLKVHIVENATSSDAPSQMTLETQLPSELSGQSGSSDKDKNYSSRQVSLDMFSSLATDTDTSIL